jgi:DNA-binding HxlR family transcriptional regulator
MSSYAQFCPMAKAMDVVGERWTLLVVREMLLGSSSFNDLRRGVPRMSPALLSKRLKALVRAGVVERREIDGRSRYTLTPSGQELAGVVGELMTWGSRWVGTLGDAELDPHLLMWDIRRSVPVASWPRERTVVGFELTGVPVRTSRWWLVVSDGNADMCDSDPGFAVDAVVRTSLRALTEVWRGDVSWSQALDDGVVDVHGSGAACRAVPHWLGQGPSAAIPRPA